MNEEIKRWLVDFWSSEHKSIIAALLVASVCFAGGGVWAWCLRRVRREGAIKADSTITQVGADAKGENLVLENKIHRPRFELVRQCEFTNANGRCSYTFEIENAGGRAFNVYVTSDVFAGRIDLKDMGRRTKRKLKFNTTGLIHEAEFKFAFDLPDGRSSTFCLYIHERIEGSGRKWYSGGIEAG
ncbi:hypothetical protein ACSVIJ_12325 [Pseudomonas sp. NCHU5208]|uniref:hypothetical protein n=1 Tax=unclassified Pseudomonas TaxID=196821 RepID=UPI003F9AC2FD